MAKVSSRVVEDTLTIIRDAHAVRIALGSAEWHEFLDGAGAFAFQSACGSFTARKERAQRGHPYWRAYRRRDGKLHRAYLGKGAELTVSRLREVARRLAECDEQPSRPRSRRWSAVPVTSAAPGHMMAALSVISTTPASQMVRVAPQARAYSSHPMRADPLLTTKITVPTLRPGLVARARLTRRLSEHEGSHLILLSAPAGFGKTTLLTEWIAETRKPTAWLSLDAADNDPVRFWRYVIAALELAHPGVGENARALLREGQAVYLEGVISAVVNALGSCGADIALVLDDYHLITEQAIHDGLRYLLDYLPPSLQIVIASRIDPPLSLARMQACNQMAVLRANDLRFEPEEVDAFFAGRMQLKLSAKAVSLLEARTEGWVAALQLAGLALRAQKDPSDLAYLLDMLTSGAQRSLVDYLVEEVLSQQSQDVQIFLQQTAILDRLSGPLCEAVTGHAGADAMLERLERANLFLAPLGEQPRWYRYHHLFTDVLRARLRRGSPEQTASLLQRAARWHEEHGSAAEAIGYALAAADFARAARLIEQTAPDLQTRGEVRTILGWLARLPDDAVRSRPRLCLAHARALLHVSQVDAAQARLQAAEEILAIQMRAEHRRALDCAGDPLKDGIDAAHSSNHPQRPVAPDDPQMRDMLAEMWVLRGELADGRGEYRAAQTAYERARSLVSPMNLPLRTKIEIEIATEAYVLGDIMGGIAAFRAARDVSRAGGYLSGTLQALHGLGTLQMAHAQLREAAANFAAALRLGSDDKSDSPPPTLSLVHMSYGQLLYEWNDLEQAASQFRAGLKLNERSGDLGLWVRCQVGLARSLHGLGKVDEAGGLLDELERFARTTSGSQSLAALAWAVCVPLWVAQGATDKVSWWLDECGLNQGEIPETVGYNLEARYIFFAQALLACGRVDDALALLARLHTSFAATDRRHRTIQVRALQALALQAQGQGRQAQAELAEALIVGEPGGYIRTFIEGGAPLLALLTKLARSTRRRSSRQNAYPSLRYIRELLTAGGSPYVPEEADTRSPRRAADNLLSGREREILRYIADGYSNAEIARLLVVEPSTVKWHLTNVFGKLDARSRTQALVRARELGLL